MTIEMAVIWLVVFFAATMHGATGLGFGLITVPILVLFLDARAVVIIALILSAVLNLLILFQIRGRISLATAGPITLGSVIGVPFGSYLLVMTNSGTLKEIVAVLALAFSIPLMLGYSRTFRNFRVASLITGAVSGALQSSTSMGSPPAVLFMANQRLSKDDFRGTMVARSMAASALAVVGLVPTGLLSAQVTAQALLFTPALIIGFLAGSRLLRIVPQVTFQKLTVGLVAATAAVSLAGSLM